MLRFKDGISPVIAVILLLAITVVISMSLYSFLENYTNSNLNSIPTKFSDAQVRLTSQNELYLDIDKNLNFSNFKIISKSNNSVICSFETKNSSNSELVGYWDFDSRNSTAIFDKSGNNFHGTFDGDLIYFPEENFGEVLLILKNTTEHPGNSFIEVEGFNSSVFNQSNGFTYAFWFREIQNDYEWPILFDFGHPHSFFGVRAFDFGTRIGFEFSRPPYDGSFFSSFKLNRTDSDWNFYVITSDGNNYDFYINKEKVNSFSSSDPLVSPNPRNLIFGSGQESNIVLDEFRIFNQSLSQEEIKNLYYFNTLNLNLNKGVNKIWYKNCNLKSSDKYYLLAEDSNGNTLNVDFKLN